MPYYRIIIDNCKCDSVESCATKLLIAFHCSSIYTIAYSSPSYVSRQYQLCHTGRFILQPTPNARTPSPSATLILPLRDASTTITHADRSFPMTCYDSSPTHDTIDEIITAETLEGESSKPPITINGRGAIKRLRLLQRKLSSKIAL